MKRFSYCIAVIVCGLCFYGCADEHEVVIGDGGNQSSAADEDSGTEDTDKNDKKTKPEQKEDPEDEQDPSDEGNKPGSDDKTPEPVERPGDGGEPPEKDCDCPVGQNCVEGQCEPVCEDGTELCGTECLNFNDLHLESCEACSAGYCDTDENLANGCEASTQDDDNHCGACGNACSEGEKCSEGTCTLICQDGELYCNGECLKAEELHLAACDACAENYCDTDNNLANGCEAFALADDAGNCGACGLACNAGESCVSGSCRKPYRVMLMKNGGIYSEASANGGGVGSKYDYVYVFDELDGWYHVTFNGNEGWVLKSDTLYACDECEGRKAIDMAEKLLYNPGTHMCTFDHYNAKTVPEFSEKFVSLAAHSSCNYGYDLNCANFVTAILRANGLMNSSAYTFVDDVYAHCTSGKDGYRVIDKSQAKPGDFWVTNTMSHAELVVGYYNGALLLIGSNNFDKSTSLTNMCQETALTNGKYSSAANDYQRVSYGGEYIWGYVCSRQ